MRPASYGHSNESSFHSTFATVGLRKYRKDCTDMNERNCSSRCNQEGRNQRLMSQSFRFGGAMGNPRYGVRQGSTEQRSPSFTFFGRMTDRNDLNTKLVTEDSRVVEKKVACH
jgi:hypothetical protein